MGRVVASAAALALLCACGSPGEGSVGGQFYNSGGPTPQRGDRGGTIEVRLGTPKVVMVSATEGRTVLPTKVVDSQTIDPGEYFNFRLKPGRYTLVAKEDNERCYAEVTVAKGESRTQDVVCVRK